MTVHNCPKRLVRKMRTVVDQLHLLVAYCEENNIDVDAMLVSAKRQYLDEDMQQAQYLRNLGVDDTVKSNDGVE